MGRLLAYVTGLVNQELLLQFEYLAAEKGILRAHAPARLPLSNAERGTVAEIGKRLGQKVWLNPQIAKPEMILRWSRRTAMVQSTGLIRDGRGLTA